jgi:hypothetical protein
MHPSVYYQLSVTRSYCSHMVSDNSLYDRPTMMHVMDLDI